MADWWQAEEVKLGRALSGRPGGVPMAGIPMPSLPSHTSAAALQDGPRWGSGADAQDTRVKLTKGQKKQARAAGAAAIPPLPLPAPKAPYLRPNKGAGKAAKGPKFPDNYSGCFHCGSKKHLLTNCPT